MANYYNQPPPTSGRTRPQARYQAYGMNSNYDNNNTPGNNAQAYAGYSAQNGPPTSGYQQPPAQPPTTAPPQQQYQNSGYGNGPPQQQYQAYNNNYYNNNNNNNSNPSNNPVDIGSNNNPIAGGGGGVGTGYNTQQYAQGPPGGNTGDVFNQNPPSPQYNNISTIKTGTNNSINSRKASASSRYGQYGVKKQPKVR